MALVAVSLLAIPAAQGANIVYTGNPDGHGGSSIVAGLYDVGEILPDTPTPDVDHPRLPFNLHGGPGGCGDGGLLDDGDPCGGSGEETTSPDSAGTVRPVEVVPQETLHESSSRSMGQRPGTQETVVTTAAWTAPIAETVASAPLGGLVPVAAAALVLLVPILLRSRSQDNEVRDRIFDLVVDDPGITASDVADRIDVHLTTAIYHLERLQDQDRIEGLRQGRSTLYFENHHKYGRVEKRVLTALKKDTPSNLLALVAENPGIHCAELARRLDLSRTSVKWHTDRLTDEGLLETDRSDGVLHLEIPEQAEQIMHRFGPSV